MLVWAETGLSLSLSSIHHSVLPYGGKTLQTSLLPLHLSGCYSKLFLWGCLMSIEGMGGVQHPVL